MKVAILVLSDLHITSSGSNPILNRVKNIVTAAYPRLKSADSAHILLCGDVAMRGSDNDYALAGTLISGLREEFSTLLQSSPRIFAVPGNHDCAIPDADARDALIDASTGHDVEALTACQRSFQQFAAQHDITVPDCDKISSWSTLGDAENKVGFLLVNSAWMSRRDEAQSLKLRFEDISAPKCAISIGAVHHPLNWLSADNGREVWQDLGRRVDLLITGHEHGTRDGAALDDDGVGFAYLEAGVGQDSDAPDHSTFKVLILDTSVRSRSVFTFSWHAGDQGHGSYREITETTTKELPPVRHTGLFQPTSQWLRELNDLGLNLTHPRGDLSLRDIFIEPAVEELTVPEAARARDASVTNNSRNKTFGPRRTSDVATPILKDSGHFIVFGDDSAGKTIYAKSLTLEALERGNMPVLLNGSDLRYRTEKRACGDVTSTAAEVYAGLIDDYFQMVPIDQRVLIIDNFDRATWTRDEREAWLRVVVPLFRLTVVMAAESSRISLLVESANDGATSETSMLLLLFKHVNLMPFGFLKQRDLIERWYHLDRSLSDDERRTRVRAAESAIHDMVRVKFLPSYPLFLLIILSQMHARVAVHTFSGARGYLYEALITSLLKKVSTNETDIGRRYTYLSEFALYLFKLRLPSASVDAIAEFHSRYVRDYAMKLNSDREFEMLIKCGLLRRDRQGVTFRYENFRCYFIAKGLSGLLDETETREALVEMSRALHIPENANIFICLAYLSRERSTYIVELLLQANRSLFAEFDEGDVAKVDIQALPPVKLSLDHRSPEERQRELLEAADASRQEELEPTQLDPKDDVPVKEILQVNAAFKNIQILGQVLRDFPGSTKRTQKEEIARACYALGLRILGFTYLAIEHSEQDVQSMASELVRLAEEQSPYGDVSGGTKKSKKRLSHAQAEVMVKTVLYRFAEQVTFSVIRHMVASTAAVDLQPIYDSIFEAKNEPSATYAMVDLALKLDLQPTMPTEQAIALYENLEKKALARRVIRHLLYRHMYLFPVVYKTRQLLCQKLEIGHSKKLIDNNVRLLDRKVRH